MGLENIRIVLVRPLYGGNVGSVCRAMRNMGLSDLCLVAPQADYHGVEARKMATHAADLLEQLRTVKTLTEAAADCGLVAGATARLGLYRAHAQTPREWAPRLLEAAERRPVALVFGPEDSGLTNEELAICTQVIQIPSEPDYASLNLAQAVMLCAYELYLAAECFEGSIEPSDEASVESRERMFGIWRETLLEIGFMKEDKARHMMMGLRRILSRGPLSENDVKILMGIARQTQWCAAQMRRADR